MKENIKTLLLVQKQEATEVAENNVSTRAHELRRRGWETITLDEDPEVSSFVI